MAVKHAHRVGSFRISDAAERSAAARLSFEGDKGMTDQSFKDEVDINNILKKADMNLIAQHFAQYNGEYQDFTQDFDYHTSMLRVKESERMFDSLPARVRARFNNDVGEFLDFVSNDANKDEMINLGLMRPTLQNSSQVASNGVMSGAPAQDGSVSSGEAK